MLPPGGREPATGRSGPRRYLLGAAVAFSAGILAGRHLELAPVHILVAALVAALAGLPAFLASSRTGLGTTALVLAFLAGALNFSARAAHRPVGDVGHVAGLRPGSAALVTVTGRVLGTWPASQGSSPGQRMTLTVDVFAYTATGTANPMRIPQMNRPMCASAWKKSLRNFLEYVGSAGTMDCPHASAAFQGPEDRAH